MDDIIEKYILEFVDNPIKAPELVTKIITHISIVHPEKDYDAEIIMDIIDSMVDQGKLIEICYTLPNSDYRERSMYFPVWTEIKITQPIDRIF